MPSTISILKALTLGLSLVAGVEAQSSSSSSSSVQSSSASSKASSSSTGELQQHFAFIRKLLECSTAIGGGYSPREREGQDNGAEEGPVLWV